MSYKPERKYIAEIKGLTNSLYYQTGGNWFHGYEIYERTPGGVAEQPDSFEILRNDFVINFENPAGSAWKYSGSLSESGTYHFKYDAILHVADTTEFEKFCIRRFGNPAINVTDGYTPSPGEPIGNSPYNGASPFALRTDVIRRYTDTTINGNNYRNVNLEFILDYDSTVLGYNGLFAMWTSNTNTKHVTEWIYQRIEITKI